MAPDTRIFSPLAVPGLWVTIGRYWYLFKRLTAGSAGRFYRFEHIVTYSSGKVVAKSDPVPNSFNSASACSSHNPISISRIIAIAVARRCE